jgi:hypothetical protein
MECGDLEGRKGLGVLGLVAFLGAIVSMGACCKHRACCDGHDQHYGCSCERCRGHGYDRHGHGADGGYGRGSGRRIDPMRILDKRFASGEIDEEEYKHRRDVLRENS